MNFRPVSRQAWAVVAEPAKGSRMVQPSGVIWSRSRRRGMGFSVRCFRLVPATMERRKTPGRHLSVAGAQFALAADEDEFALAFEFALGWSGSGFVPYDDTTPEPASGL